MKGVGRWDGIGGRACFPAAGTVDGAVFVGRERELAVLDASFGEAAGGSGRLVMLSGEPGIGKTTLVRAFVERLRDRAVRVLWSRCLELAPDLWPWVQALSPSAPEADREQAPTPTLGDGAAAVGRLVRELHERVPASSVEAAAEGGPSIVRFGAALAGSLKRAARRGPLLLVLDDLRWADGPSLAVLQLLARELVDARLLVIGIHRDTGVRHGIRNPLARALGALAQEPATRHVHLGPLALPDVADYVASVTAAPPRDDVVSALMRYTGGHPLYVAKMIPQLQSGRERANGGGPRFLLPDAVRAAIGHRLDALSLACRCLLVTAAVVGDAFDLSTLEAVGPCCVPAHARRHLAACAKGCRLRRTAPGAQAGPVLELMEEALAAGILAEVPDAPGRFAFTHGLIRETLTRERTAARVALLRQHIAEGRGRDDRGRVPARANGAGSNGSQTPRSAPPAPREGYVFRKEGGLWTVVYEDATLHLQDLRGMHYLAQLVYAPGREIHVCDLVAAATRLHAGEPHSAGRWVSEGLRIATQLGDAEPVLDPRAVAEYRARLGELRTELAEEEDRHDMGRAARIRSEIDLLLDQLAALRKRPHASKHAERARLSVTKGIAIALKPIAARHAGLADHLRATVKCGYVCSYTPDPRRPVSWSS